MHLKKTILCICLIVSVSPVSMAWGDVGSGPLPAKLGLDAHGQFRMSPQDRCPVCGMFPVRYPRHAAAMVMADGATYYFCCNGCLLQAFFQPDRHLGAHHAEVSELRVIDYFNGSILDARKAIWVAGSDVIGPMGRAFVTLSGAAAVEAFKTRHGGRDVFTLEKLDQVRFKHLFSINH